MPIENIVETGVLTAQRDRPAGNEATVVKKESLGSVISDRNRYRVRNLGSRTQRNDFVNRGENP